jgi:hypothetical protein
MQRTTQIDGLRPKRKPNVVVYRTARDCAPFRCDAQTTGTPGMLRGYPRNSRRSVSALFQALMVLSLSLAARGRRSAGMPEKCTSCPTLKCPLIARLRCPAQLKVQSRGSPVYSWHRWGIGRDGRAMGRRLEDRRIVGAYSPCGCSTPAHDGSAAVSGVHSLGTREPGHRATARRLRARRVATVFLGNSQP